MFITQASDVSGLVRLLAQIFSWLIANSAKVKDSCNGDGRKSVVADANESADRFD